MRFVGLFLLVVFLLGGPLILGGIEFLVQPIHLIAVIIGCLAASLISFSAKDIVRATVAFFNSSDYSQDELKLFAQIQRAESKFILVAGAIVSLVGIIIEISVGEPPSAPRVMQALSAFIYGLFFSYLWCLPAALYYERKIK